MGKVWLFIWATYVSVLSFGLLVLLFIAMYETVTDEEVTVPKWVAKSVPCYFLSGGVFVLLFF